MWNVMVLRSPVIHPRRPAGEGAPAAGWTTSERRRVGLGRSGASRLAGVGVTARTAASLPSGGARSLAIWSDIKVSRGQNLAVLAVAFSYGPIAAVLFGVDGWMMFMIWTAVAGVVLYPGFRFGAAEGLERVFRRFDNYREYGQAGFRLIYAIQDSGLLAGSGRMNLRQMETAVRSAHTWRKLGSDTGVDHAWRSRRVFDLLHQYPLDSAAATEICDLTRSSLVDTAGARVDPFTYRVTKNFRRSSPRFELANSLMTLVAAALGLLVVVLPVLLSR
ncbi:hypothetical protein [Promicromonospora sp. NPDC090134]|uniref:hypothetical protein n=1 Tax=Promicromonospora sp. NPDC090134 TaxID=3364408 RepID=UPI0037F5CBEB